MKSANKKLKKEWIPASAGMTTWNMPNSSARRLEFTNIWPKSQKSHKGWRQQNVKENCTCIATSFQRHSLPRHHSNVTHYLNVIPEDESHSHVIPAEAGIHKAKKTLMNSVFVIPAQAGVQENQSIIDSRLRGNDINQSSLKILIFITNNMSNQMGINHGSVINRGLRRNPLFDGF